MEGVMDALDVVGAGLIKFGVVGSGMGCGDVVCGGGLLMTVVWGGAACGGGCCIVV